MRTILAAALMFVGLTCSAMAQEPGRHPPIDLANVGGGILGLTLATGAANLYDAGYRLFRGSSFVDALEAGTGLPILASVAVVILGGIYGHDLFLEVFGGSSDATEMTTPPKRQH